MNIDNIIRKAVLATSVLGVAAAMAAPASAGTREINIYGASAQFIFWNANNATFLHTVGGCGGDCSGLPCTELSPDGKQGITYGKACANFGGDDVIIRYASKASYDGILAVSGQASPLGVPCDLDGNGTISCVNNEDTDCFGRMMANESATTFDGNSTTRGVGGTRCVRVNVGASDVSGDSFVQETHGELKGYFNGGWVDRVFNSINTTGLEHYNPIIVPFGFFAHNSVTVTKCMAPDADQSAAHKAISAEGNFCYDPDNDGRSADCIGYYKCVSGTCSGGVNSGNACTKAKDCPDVTLADTSCKEMPLDNVSRPMAVAIFSDQAYYWTDFGAWFNSNPISANLRHAGSGTHATIDWAVMNHGKWGYSLAKNEVDAYDTSDHSVYFNDGSGDMMKSLNSLTGAIGYADADQLAGTSNYPNVHAMKYQGVEPRRTTIRNGLYDFWSSQWMYYKSTVDPGTKEVIDALNDYAQNAGNLTSEYWATKSEMVYMKGDDTKYPGYTGATNPQLP